MTCSKGLTSRRFTMTGPGYTYTRRPGTRSPKEVGYTPVVWRSLAWKERWASLVRHWADEWAESQAKSKRFKSSFCQTRFVQRRSVTNQKGQKASLKLKQSLKRNKDRYLGRTLQKKDDTHRLGTAKKPHHTTRSGRPIYRPDLYQAAKVIGVASKLSCAYSYHCMLNSLNNEGRMLCIVISTGIYHLYFASTSSAIIAMPTPISRFVFVSRCILHCSTNQKYLKLRVPCGS